MGGVPSKPDFERFDRPLAIGAGYSRTGTNSMQLALEKLYDALCQHGGTHLLSREDAWGKLWCTAMKQQRHGQKEEVLKAVREGCRGFAALTDMPAILFVEELLELYPDSKFVLVIRDPQKWWDSLSHLLDYVDAWYLPVIFSVAPGLRWAPVLVNEWKIRTQQRMKVLGKKPGDYGPWIMEEYNDKIRKVVPKDQSLEMSLSEGWEPLCRFLDKPIPNEPFSRVNDGEVIGPTRARLIGKVLCIWAGLFSVVGLAGYGVAELLRQ